MLQIQRKLPETLKATKRACGIEPTPASTGAKVRTIGTKRAIMTVFPPCVS
jgi:hypothetical protein